MEAGHLARYLFGIRGLPQELALRYMAANRKRLSLPFSALSAPDAALLRWWHRFPFLFPFLEAGARLRARENILSKKAQVLFAVVETDPDFFSFFEERPAWRLVLLGRLLKEGVSAFFKMGIGFFLVRVLR